MTADVLHHPRRQWAAAKTTSLTSYWAETPKPTDFDLKLGLRTLRARSRDMAKNSDHARGFVRLARVNVIGPDGIRMQSRARTRGGRLDRRVNDAIETWWQVWGERGHCDVSGRYSWRAIQAEVLRSCVVDGEALVRIFAGWDNPHGFAVQILDPELLDVDYNVAANSRGRKITLGIETDQWDRPLAYHLSDSPDIQSGAYRGRERKRTRIPADQILHIYLPEGASQSRGVPWMATPLQRLYMLSGYEDAELVAARAASSKTAFYRRQPDAPPLRDPKDDSGEFQQTLTAGTLEILPSGYDLVPFDPQHPTQSFGEFVKASLRSIATGLGISYNALANDLEGVNYSSLRHGALQERDLWMDLQAWLIEEFCAPVYERWLASQLALSAIQFANGRPIPENRWSEYRRVRWQPRRWAWVDPLKEIEAQQKEVALRVRSVSDIIREQGRDPDEVWEELSADLARLDALDIAPTTEGLAAASAPPADPSNAAVDPDIEEDTEDDAEPTDE